MVRVSTKEDLKRAIENKESEIILEGALAEKIIKKKKLGKYAMIGGALLAVAGAIALPFTGGASTPAVVSGLTLTTAAGTIIEISTAELLAILGAGTVVGSSVVGTVGYALYKSYSIEVATGKDGKAIVKLSPKQ